MNEKDVMLSTDDCGRDLPSVQALQRKHDTVERDLNALEEKVCCVRCVMSAYLIINCGFNNERLAYMRIWVVEMLYVIFKIEYADLCPCCYTCDFLQT